MKRIKVKNEEIARLLEADTTSFPKYTTQIINLANQNAQGTRPEIVGQMSELIQQFKGEKLKEWEQWYLSRHPEAIQKATDRILQMINSFQEVIPLIDEEMVRKWVKGLVIVKTFVGLKFQEAILKRISEYLGKNYRLAEPEE